MVHSSPEHQINKNKNISPPCKSLSMGGNLGKMYNEVTPALSDEPELKFSRSIPSMFNIVSQCENLEDNTGSNR